MENKIPPLSSIFSEFSRYYKQWKAGYITAEDFRKSMGMSKGIFYHYLREYIVIINHAMPQDE